MRPSWLAAVVGSAAHTLCIAQHCLPPTSHMATWYAQIDAVILDELDTRSAPLVFGSDAGPSVRRPVLELKALSVSLSVSHELHTSCAVSTPLILLCAGQHCLYDDWGSSAPCA